MAAQEGHADVVKYLLTSGANQSLSTKVSADSSVIQNSQSIMSQEL